MQREFCGRGKIEAISSELRAVRAKRLLLVTGKDSFTTCGAKKALEPFLADYTVCEFNDFSLYPTLAEISSGIELFRSHQCDTIIAVGGGSRIDVAKSINAMQAHRGLEEAIIRGETTLTNSLAPMLAIPTTAGSGSEATHFAVIYHDGKKYSLASPMLLPDVAIIDAAFTDSLPPYITACTGFDALSQAVESFWAKNANVESRQYAAAAISLLLENLPLIAKSNSRTTRDKLIHAANLAGKAINISKTTAPHALSYKISTGYGVAHGHAVALTLGEFFTLHARVLRDSDEGTSSELSQLTEKLHQLFAVGNASDAKMKWYALMGHCGLETDLQKLGIHGQEVFEKIVTSVNLERLNNHPIQVSFDMMMDILQARAMEDRRPT